MRTLHPLFRAALATLGLAAAGTAADPVSGWRGNMTGLWPDTHPPLEWHRIPRGALDGMRATADRPKGRDAADAPLVSKGLVREWLVIGPFTVPDSINDFDTDALGGETTTEPAAGQRVGDLAWRPATVPPD